MPELLFSLDGVFDQHAHGMLTRYNSGEHFGCDPVPLAPEGELRMQVETSPTLPLLISAHTTWSRYAFRRTRVHIRRDRSQFCIINYVERGAMKISQGGCETITHAGEFVIVPVSEPFTVEFIPDQACHRALYILCPTDDVQRHIPFFTASAALHAGGETIEAAGKMLDLLYWDGEAMNDCSFRSILDAMFRQIAVNATGEAVGHLSAHDQRLRDIRAYLELHLGRPGLCLSEISKDLGLSVRYITKLFQRHDTSFSRVLWAMRLEQVRDWLESPDKNERTVAEVAYSAGFKSAPHLSKMFQDKFGMSPRAYRRLKLVHLSAAKRLN